jgi:transcriptional regulator with XRE-family HTH domain
LEIGERLRRARVGIGLTLLELGARAGVEPGELASIEQGLVLPDADLVRALALQLDVHPELLGRALERTREDEGRREERLADRRDARIVRERLLEQHRLRNEYKRRLGYAEGA